MIMELKYEDIKSLTKDELVELTVSLGGQKFRGGQVYDWIHKKLVTSYDEMTNVPKKLRDDLRNISEVSTVTMADKRGSQIDGTAKYLFRLSDGNVIESVLMR